LDKEKTALKTLLLNPPSYDDFDGGAGSRYQATREVSSFWYPTWLCYPAGLIEESRVVDAPAHHLNLDQVVSIAQEYQLIAIYTSTPSFEKDLQTVQAIRRFHPGRPLIGFVGPHPSALPEESLKRGRDLDFVARKECDYTLAEIASGEPLSVIKGISYRDGSTIIHNPDREPVEDLDALPFVTRIYKRDLDYKKYMIPYLRYPYISIYTGRGCASRCIYCLWPQTISGHRYRVRSVPNVIREVEESLGAFPDVQEIFFDDDTFTAHRGRMHEFAQQIKPLGITWSTTSRANVDYETLKKLKESGLRLLVVGYETGSRRILKNIKKGITPEGALEFTRNCRKLGIQVHGTFILGLPEESKESVEESIRYACALNPDTIQVSLASAYPGTEFYQLCQERGYFVRNEWVDEGGYQVFNLSYPDMDAREIYRAVETFYKRFYYRPRFMLKMALKMLVDSSERKRRLEEGREFKRFIRRRRDILARWPKSESS
jgi:hopanoid biosynthesis associated radical SAM protein HpnJ